MHVMVLTDTFPNRYEQWRGPYNRRQIECLAELCRVTVINPLPWPRLLTDPRKLSLFGCRDRCLDRAFLFHSPLWYVPRLGRARTWIGFERAVRRIMKTRYLGSVHVLMATFAYPAGRAAMELAVEMEVPYVVKVRGTDLHSLPSDGPVRRRTIEALRNADAVVAVSSNLAQIAEELGTPSGRVYVLPNGVDSDRFPLRPRQSARAELGLDASRRVVLFVGNLLPVKGVDVLLKAVKQYSSAGSHEQRTLFAVAGDGPMRRVLKSATEELPANVDLRALGQIGREEVGVWMNAADVLVLPSRNEGCPNVVLEAMCCGTPVVASAVGAVPDLLTSESGTMVPPDDPEELASALISALLKRWDRASIRRRVRRMSWERNARTLQRILRDVAGTPDEPTEEFTASEVS